MSGDIQPVQQLFVAARTAQRIAQGQPLGVAMFVDQPEQLDDAARRDLDAAATLLDQYFDGQTPAVQSAQQTLQQVAQQARMSEPPGIARALQALAAAEEHTAVAAIPAAPASAASH